MKRFAIVLLLANLALAVYAWLREKSADPDAQIVRQQLHADQIRIVAPPPKPLPPPAVSTTAAVVPAPEVCAQWGSFSASEADKAKADLDGLALGDRLRQTEVSVSVDYWVYLPPQKGKAEMDRKISELKARGVLDYVPIVEAGRWRYAISLGLFRSEEGARKFLSAMREKGVRSAQLGQRGQKISQVAFLVRNPTEKQSAQLSALAAGYPGTELQPVDCPPG